MKNHVSVVIATFSRCDDLKKTLDSLFMQETDGSFSFDVVVVDNNSTDLTKGIVEKFKARYNDQLNYFFESTQGKSCALNKGITEAKGDIIAFTDDDVMIDPKWLSALVRCFEQYPCDGIGGRVLPIYPENTPRWIKDNPTKIAGAVVIYDYGDEICIYNPLRYPFLGANFAFRKEVFEECGMFRTDLVFSFRIALGEDTEFIERLLSKGKTLYYCGKALVYHPVNLKRINLRHIARWHMALGKFDAQREMKKGKTFIFYFGVPRYIIKGIFLDFLQLVTHCLNRPAFWNAWRSFFRKWGMIEEYRLSRVKGM